MNGTCVSLSDCSNNNCMNKICTGLYYLFFSYINTFIINTKISVANNVGSQCLLGPDCKSGNCVQNKCTGMCVTSFF